jgi:hypothetical protein
LTAIASLQATFFNVPPVLLAAPQVGQRRLFPLQFSLQAVYPHLLGICAPLVQRLLGQLLADFGVARHDGGHLGAEVIQQVQQLVPRDFHTPRLTADIWSPVPALVSDFFSAATSAWISSAVGGGVFFVLSVVFFILIFSFIK